MDFQSIGEVARLINHYASRFPQERRELEENPTAYFSSKLSIAGLEVPSGFHVHIISNDGDSPEEAPDIATVDRTVFTLNSKNELSRADYKASDSSGGFRVAGGNASCNGCTLCLIVGGAPI